MPMDEPTPVPCRAANMAGVPVVALEWSGLRETYLAPDHEASSVAIDYIVSPRAHVDRVSLSFDFDPLTPVDAMAFDGECRLAFPVAAMAEVLPDGSEDVVSATVIASSESGTARTGRLSVSTGTGSIEIRTSGLDAGDPAEGSWWALFEPAAGNARLVVVPATLDRSTFRITGIPANQPGVVALIQTRALQYDAGTRTVYAPWGFAGDWRRYARSWYGAVLLQQPDGLVQLDAVVPPNSDITEVHRGTSGPVLADGATREYRVLSSGEEDVAIEVACDAPVIAIDALSFVEFTVGAATERVLPGGTITVEGSCDAGADSWALEVHSRSMNGRAGAVMVRRGGEVTP